MRKKSAKYAVLSLFFLTIMIITVFHLFKVRIADIYFSSKYDAELRYVRSCLYLLRDGNISEIKKICDISCRVLRPDFLKSYKNILKKTDIDSMRVRIAERRPENGGDRFIVIVYFENDTRLYLHLTLKKQSGIWIMMSFGISEAFRSYLTEQDGF